MQYACALTLIRSSLLATFGSCMQLLLAVTLERRQRHFHARCSLHPGEQLRVRHLSRGTVGVPYGGSNVTTDLCTAERARSARLRSLLQRLRCAIPAGVPAREGQRSSLDAVSSSQRLEAVAPHPRPVLEQDVVLGSGAQMRHVLRVAEGCEVGGTGRVRWCADRKNPPSHLSAQLRCRQPASTHINTSNRGTTNMFAHGCEQGMKIKMLLVWE